MNDFKRLNELVAQKKAQMNEIYKDLNHELIARGLEICKLSGTSSERIAVARRVIDLKVDPLENELKKLGRNEAEILATKKAMYEYVRELYEARHKELLDVAQSEKILDEFYMALLRGMHSVGLVLNAWQVRWEKQILDTTNAEFSHKFASLDEAGKFISEHKLYQLDENGVRADRTYGAVIKDGENFSFAPYAVAFTDDVKSAQKAFIAMIDELKTASEKVIQTISDEAQKREILAEHTSYIKYFMALNAAFGERENDRVVPAWQAAEVAWMSVRGALQPGHPLEYYEDAYTHAVALEWDVRLASNGDVDEEKFKANVIESYEQICKRVGIFSENDEQDSKSITQNFFQMHEQVRQNVKRTQLYVSVPLIYYGAELNGLFSAQVVPNDESVSAKCGKKIFAFVEHVYASAKAKPFMRLGAEIFSRDFLDFGREILFLKPKVWKKVYEISTIGHEFGHILFIDSDTENTMNKGGVFKFIEEYKATTGGLVNFFLHEQAEYKMAVFHELIARAVGLIGWMKVDEVRAYYCEALIHLSLLFEAKVLKFADAKLDVDFSEQGYEKFKAKCLQNYENLASHYSHKREAGEFLAKFCEPYEATYLPKDRQTRAFVEYFYARYEAIGNEVDESGEWAKWQARANEL